MKTTDIFKDLADIRQYAPGIGAQNSLTELEPHIRMVTMDIFKLITHEVYIALREGASEDGLALLKTAIAAGTLYKYQIFLTVSKAGTESSIYKYQHEELKRNHLDIYWSALDALLSWLDNNPETGGFDQSAIYRDRQDLPIRSAAEFDRFFQIDGSAYFFSRIQYILRSIWGKMKKNVDMENSQMVELAKTALCYRTMAKVMMTFDVTEWPRCIRYDFNHEYTKGADIQDRRILANQYIGEAEECEAMVDQLMRAQRNANLQQNHNRESEKHFTML